MTYLDAQILAIHAQCLRAHAEIVSGKYKERTTQQGTDEVHPSGDGRTVWRDLTEEEKLTDSVGTLNAQIKRLNEFIDAKGER